ncbi:MAG: hypothetical protein J6S41_01310 [Clostridia bacterium]|nr:hypothetical protein [Clostridia bacterium]
MKLIPYYDYYYDRRQTFADRGMEILHDLAKSSDGTVVCRVRRSKDGVVFICLEPTLARLCLCEERVENLRFAEIDALMRLCNMHILTLDKLLSSYEGEAQVVLHFRGFRPDADIVSRVVRDVRFSFGTDSAEQLSVIAEAYPAHKTVGFVSHLRAAETMKQAGAAVLCLYGREPGAYTSGQIEPLTERCEVWMEIPPYATADLDSMVESASAVGCSGIVLPLELIQ